MNKIRCEYCGTKNIADNDACWRCGANLPEIELDLTDPEKIVEIPCGHPPEPRAEVDGGIQIGFAPLGFPPPGYYRNGDGNLKEYPEPSDEGEDFGVVDGDDFLAYMAVGLVCLIFTWLIIGIILGG